MAFNINHHTAADGTFSPTGAIEWDRVHDFTGILPVANGGTGVDGSTLTSGRVALIGTGGIITDDAGLTYNSTTDILTVAGAVSVANGQHAFTNSTALNTTSYGFDGGGLCMLTVANAKLVNWSATYTRHSTNVPIGWTTGAVDGTGLSAGMCRVADNSILFGGAISASPSGAATSRTEINKAVTAFTDGVAKAVLTVTIPNAAHSAVLEVEVLGMLGAGGAIGAGEAVATNTYKFVITRTAGVNAVVAPSSAYGAAADAVAGATTVTATAADSAISGAVGATNTFTVDVTITKGGGSSDNHTALIYAKLMNNAASGITVA